MSFDTSSIENTKKSKDGFKHCFVLQESDTPVMLPDCGPVIVGTDTTVYDNEKRARGCFLEKLRDGLAAFMQPDSVDVESWSRRKYMYEGFASQAFDADGEIRVSQETIDTNEFPEFRSKFFILSKKTIVTK